MVLDAATTTEALARLFGERTHVVYGVYHLASRLVGVPDLGRESHGLFAPPADFPQFALDLVRSVHVREVLG